MNDKILDFVRRDLGEYDQENLYPRSKTVVEGDSFRHYELGSIIGYLLFGSLSNIDSAIITQIEEDDEFWFVPEKAMFMSPYWINSAHDTFSRMKDWFDEHIFMGYDNDYVYKSYIKKEIKNEEIKLNFILLQRPVLLIWPRVVLQR